jgi:hypothetical protein
VGTIWRSSRCAISVGKSIFIRSSTSVLEKALMPSSAPLSRPACSKARPSSERRARPWSPARRRRRDPQVRIGRSASDRRNGLWSIADDADRGTRTRMHTAIPQPRFIQEQQRLAPGPKGCGGTAWFPECCRTFMRLGAPGCWLTQGRLLAGRATHMQRANRDRRREKRGGGRCDRRTADGGIHPSHRVAAPAPRDKSRSAIAVRRHR